MTVTSRPAADAARPVVPHQLNDEWCAAFNAGDLDLLMTMYEPDAVLVPGPGAPVLRGHAAIRAALEAFLGLGGTLSFEPNYWLEHGDLVAASIRFVMDGGTDPAGNPIDLRGATAEVLRRQPDGTWKYLVDHPFAG